MATGNYHQVQITAIIAETRETKTFVLQPLNNWIAEYRPGQFLTLVFNTRYGEKRRSYSISSSPALKEAFCITIKRVENGEFSRLLLAHAKVGDVLTTSGISGFFVLPQNIDATDQFFFLAAGSGITPCYSIINTLLSTSQKKIVLIYSNRTEEETIFLQQLRTLEHQFAERFQVHFLFSNKTSVYESRLGNWLLQQLLVRYLQVDKAKALFYLCGPFEYMQMISISLLSEGYPAQHIHKENFSSIHRIVKPLPPDIAEHQVKLYLKEEAYSLTVQYPQSILAVAKASNIAIPYSCEAGRCGSCAATCIKGKVWMAYNEVLMDDEIAKGRILCCQAYPVEGDVEIVIG
jgi:ring-1,2-phenylacetyl-CoA epoxidase subunit PaaE